MALRVTSPHRATRNLAVYRVSLYLELYTPLIQREALRVVCLLSQRTHVLILRPYLLKREALLLHLNALHIHHLIGLYVLLYNVLPVLVRVHHHFPTLPPISISTILPIICRSLRRTLSIQNARTHVLSTIT